MTVVSTSAAASGWRTPFAALAFMATANAVAFSTWNALFDPFTSPVPAKP